MKPTGHAAQHRVRHGRRWLLASAAAAVLVAAGLATLLSTPVLPHRTASAGPFTSTSVSVSSGVGGRAVVSPGATSPSAAPRTTPAASVSSTTTRASAAGSSAAASTAGAPLAGLIEPGVSYHGNATEYAAGNGDGACTFGPAATMMIAAMNYTDYDAAKACGAYVLVTASNGASITVLITNECPAPCAPGQLDLSQQAFAKLANPAAGIIPITWRLLSPAISNTVAIRYKTGSSRYWCAIQVIGHRNPVARLEVDTADGWQQLPRTDYNYFLSANGDGCGNAIRITDIYGQQLTVSGIALSPNVVQPTSVQFAQD